MKYLSKSTHSLRGIFSSLIRLKVKIPLVFDIFNSTYDWNISNTLNYYTYLEYHYSKYLLDF